MHSDFNQKINQLHEKFSECGRNAKEWQRKCGLLLGDVEKFEVWKKKGFSCIYEYAAKLAGMNKFQVDEALRIFRRIEDKPALLEVAQKKGLYAVKPVATIATAETDKFWAKHAMDMPKNELETFVKNVKNQNKKNPGVFSGKIIQNESSNIDAGNFAEKLEMLTLNLKPEILLKLKKLYQGDWNELMEKLISSYEENFGKELEKQKPVPAENTSRHIPRDIERYVLERSNGKCEFPSCHQDYDHLHHTNRYASDKVHDPDKIVALCKAHHGLAHRGLIDNEASSVKIWKIRKERDYKSLDWFVDRQVQSYR